MLLSETIGGNVNGACFEFLEVDIWDILKYLSPSSMIYIYVYNTRRMVAPGRSRCSAPIISDFPTICMG